MKLIEEIKNIIKKKDESHYSTLDNNFKRFQYLANIISNENFEIIKTKDQIGSIYKNKIILPEIKISEKEEINIKCYIYKIIFLIFAKNLKLNIKLNEKKNDYIFISSILTVKNIIKKIKKNLKNFNELMKKIYPEINKNREKIKLNGEKTKFLEIITNKLMYKKTKKKYKLQKYEKILIYKIENIKKIETNFEYKLKNIYLDIEKVYKKYEKINLNILWGYVYYEKEKKYTEKIKNFIKNNYTENKLSYEKNTTIKKKINNKNKNKNKNINLNILFNYKKTINSYRKINKNIDKNTEKIENKILKDTNANYLTENNKNKIITTAENDNNNNLNIKRIINLKKKTKKHIYNEWDFKTKKYKNNWCNVFVENKKTNLKENQNYINKITTNYKKDINVLKKSISLIKNEKIWIKKQIHGEDIDFDTIIDNYKEIKENKFNKIYKYKKINKQNIIILLLIDSSSSTDSFSKKEKTIEKIKKLTLILASAFNNTIENYLIAAFNSNTRHDCSYKIIKNLYEKYKKTNIDILQIIPSGYTRIGVAIRHSINIIKSTKNKKKLIIILTDGNPTDYDEYEGEYGIKDINMSIKEAKKKNIEIKSLIINNNDKQKLSNMFGKKNYQTIDNVINKETINFIKKIIKE